MSSFLRIAMAIWMPLILNSLSTPPDTNDTSTYTCLWWYVQLKSHIVHPQNAFDDIMKYDIDEYLALTFNHTSYTIYLQWQYANTSDVDNNNLIHVNVNIVISNKQNSSNFMNFSELSNYAQLGWNEVYGTNKIFISQSFDSGIIYNNNKYTVCGLNLSEIESQAKTSKNDDSFSKIMDIALIPTICGVISCLFLIFLIWFLKHQNKKKRIKHTHSGSRIEMSKVMHPEPVANSSHDVDVFSINDDIINRSPLPSSPIPPIDDQHNNNNIHFPLKGVINIPIKEHEELNDDHLSNNDGADDIVDDADSIKAPTTISKDDHTLSVQIVDDNKSDFIINTDDDILKIRKRNHGKHVKKQKSEDSELLYENKEDDDDDDDAVIDIQYTETNTFQTNDTITNGSDPHKTDTNNDDNNNKKKKKKKKMNNIRIKPPMNVPKIKVGEDTPLPDNDDDDEHNFDANIVYNLPILNGNNLSNTNTNTHTIHTIDTDDIKLKELYHEEIKKWFDDKLYKLLDARHEYKKLFINNGFDNLSFIKDMTERDLIQIGINKLGHRKQILLQIQKL